MAKRTKAGWQEFIDEYNKSGQTQEDWCKTHGINLFTFRGRLYKSKKAKEINNPDVSKTIYSSAPKQVEAVPSSTDWMAVKPKSSTKTMPTCKIKVDIGNFTIQVNSGFDEATLADVCKVLKSQC